MLAYHLSTLPQAAALFLDFEWGSLGLPLLWFGIIVLTLIAEGQTADLVAIWFAPGAFTSLILSFCNVVEAPMEESCKIETEVTPVDKT